MRHLRRAARQDDVGGVGHGVVSRANSRGAAGRRRATAASASARASASRGERRGEEAAHRLQRGDVAGRKGVGPAERAHRDVVRRPRRRCRAARAAARPAVGRRAAARAAARASASCAQRLDRAGAAADDAELGDALDRRGGEHAGRGKGAVDVGATASRRRLPKRSTRRRASVRAAGDRDLLAEHGADRELEARRRCRAGAGRARRAGRRARRRSPRARRRGRASGARRR